LLASLYLMQLAKYLSFDNMDQQDEEKKIDEKEAPRNIDTL